MKYYHKGHYRSHKVILNLKNNLFLRYIICLTPNLFKTFQECQHYVDINFSYNEVSPQRSSKVIKGHFNANIVLAHSFMDLGNLDLRSYGQPLSLLRIKIYIRYIYLNKIYLI